jgi:hypothetical protein
MGALVIDNKKYARVSARILPRVIATDQKHQRMLAEVEKLMDRSEYRGRERSPILCLIRVPTKCWYLMEQRGLKQAGLLPIFKSSGYVSDVVNAKRAIGKAHAKRLAAFFQEPANLFV